MQPPIHGLYVIIDPEICRGRAPADVASMAIDGGANVIQWRDKARPLDVQTADARAIRDMCIERGCTFIINDDPQLAADLDAHGVHLGQQDVGIDVARPIVGADRIVGVSTNNVAEAMLAQAAGADYVAIGAIFPTTTKTVTRAANLRRLREVDMALHIPVVAIGGINASNIRMVVDAGAASAAVISAVCAADDPRAAAAVLAAAFDEHRRTGTR